MSINKTAPAEKQEQRSKSKRSYQEQKEFNRKLRRLERETEEAVKKVEEIENKLAEMEAKLATPEGAADMDLLQQYLEVKATGPCIEQLGTVGVGAGGVQRLILLQRNIDGKF